MVEREKNVKHLANGWVGNVEWGLNFEREVGRLREKLLKLWN
jgi:hypothetical protein